MFILDTLATDGGNELMTTELSAVEASSGVSSTDAGLIAGLVIALLAAAVLGACLVYLLVTRKKSERDEGQRARTGNEMKSKSVSSFASVASGASIKSKGAESVKSTANETGTEKATASAASGGLEYEGTEIL